MFLAGDENPSSDCAFPTPWLGFRSLTESLQDATTVTGQLPLSAPYRQATTYRKSQTSLVLRSWTTQDLLNILRQVEVVLEGDHRPPRGARRKHRRGQRMVRQEYSPLTIAGWCVGLFAIAAAILMHGEKRVAKNWECL